MNIFEFMNLIFNLNLSLYVFIHFLSAISFILLETSDLSILSIFPWQLMLDKSLTLIGIIADATQI